MALEPTLDLLALDTHNTYSMAIGDISVYPTGYNIVNPTLELTPPGLDKVNLSFTAQSVNVYNSYNLGLCAQTLVSTTPIPDGIYHLKYSIHPHYKYYVEKSFLRADMLYHKFSKAFLTSDLAASSHDIKSQEFKMIREINLNIEGAIAAANSCANKLAMQLYRRANEQLDNFINNRCKSC